MMVSVFLVCLMSAITKKVTNEIQCQERTYVLMRTRSLYYGKVPAGLGVNLFRQST